MKFIKKTDIFIILIVIIISFVGFFIFKIILSNKPAKAEIYYKSELVMVVDLIETREKTFSIPQNNNVIFHVFTDGSICFSESDCPDKICIRTGKLNTIGESAACLPNEIILKIVPYDKENKNDIDLIAS